MDGRSWAVLIASLVLLGLDLIFFAVDLMALPGENKLKSFWGLLSGKSDKVSEEEILQMVDAGEETGAIQQEEREMIENIFDFDNTTAGDVMIHRTDMVMIHLEDDREEILDTIRASGLSRFPVYNEDPDDIIGVLSTRDFLLNTQAETPKALRELLREPYFVPETVRTDLLFRDMQSKKVHLAIVVDEYGGTAGLVTLEDLLEEIVGNIYDEFDPADTPEIIDLGGGKWKIAGGADLEQVSQALGLDLPESEDYDTLGGLVFAQLDVLPEDGAQVDVETCGLKIHVDAIADHRVAWATVEKPAPEVLRDTEEH